MGVRFRSPFVPDAPQVAPVSATTAAGTVAGTGASIPVMLSVASGVLGGDVALVAATDTLVLTTVALAVGTWKLAMSAELIVTGAVASDAMIWVSLGTATAVFAGPIAADGELPALAGGSLGLAFCSLVMVTVGGTLQLRAFSVLAGTVKALATAAGARAVTGYTAVKIA